MSFNDLIIKPVQRIPRYMLFIKDILKHTSQAHPDHAHLEDALEELTALADRVNEAERQSSLFNLQQELLIMVDGLAEVCSIAEFITLLTLSLKICIA